MYMRAFTLIARLCSPPGEEIVTGLVGDPLKTERFHMPPSLAAPVSIDILQNYTMILHDHPITYAPACL